jgi:hypothetical protein
MTRRETKRNKQLLQQTEIARRLHLCQAEGFHTGIDGKQQRAIIWEIWTPPVQKAAKLIRSFKVVVDVQIRDSRIRLASFKSRRAKCSSLLELEFDQVCVDAIAC